MQHQITCSSFSSALAQAVLAYFQEHFVHLSKTGLALMKGSSAEPEGCRESRNGDKNSELGEMRLPGVEQHSVSSDSLESGVIAGKGVVRAWTMEISIGQGNEEPLEAFKWGETGWGWFRVMAGTRIGLWLMLGFEPFWSGRGNALARGKLG